VKEKLVKFGMIGTGAVAQAIASRLVGAGHPVTLSSRHGPASLQDTLKSLVVGVMSWRRARWPRAGGVQGGANGWPGCRVTYF
jgi:predicted dinucleotide-binding enzyme